jgi:hypothetical protein
MEDVQIIGIGASAEVAVCKLHRSEAAEGAVVGVNGTGFAEGLGGERWEA